MKLVTGLAFLAPLAGSVRASDLVVHKEKHTDAVSTGPDSRPAEDSVQVLWIGKDRLRCEEGSRVTIVRADLGKMYLLDTAARTCSTVDLPLDLKRYVPAENAQMLDALMARMKVTVTPTAETRKIGDWNATRYTVTFRLPMMGSTTVSAGTGATTQASAPGGGTTQEVWVTKDLGGDRAGWQEMVAALSSTSPFRAAVAAEMRKIDGLPVLVETTQKLGSTEIRSREAVTSVEELEPAAGFYDLPAGFTEKPFDPLADMMGLARAR